MNPVDRESETLLTGKAALVFILIFPNSVKNFHESNETSQTCRFTFFSLVKEPCRLVRARFIIS